MRIVHFADLHLGVETYGVVDPDTGLSSRLLDILRALDEVVEYAISNKVDLVLFCGDAYKTRDPSQTQQREFAKRLRRLSEAEIPVFLLVGNHDLPSAIGRATAVEIFDTLAVSHIYVGNHPGIYHIPTKRGNIQVVALPWLRRSVLLSRDETKNLNIEQVNDLLQQTLTRTLLGVISELDLSLPAVLAAHVSVSTAKPGSERSMVVGKDPVLLPSALAQRAFDYIALGHVHRCQELLQSPPVVYAGSLERFDFGDEDQEKGFYVVDIELRGKERHVEYEFRKVNARRFVTVKAEIDVGDQNPTATVLRTIAQRQPEVQDAVVRVHLSLPGILEASLREAEINRALKAAHYVSIIKEVRRESCPRLGQWTSQKLTPSEALRKYLEARKVTEERQKVLLEYGERLILEAEQEIGEKAEVGR